MPGPDPFWYKAYIPCFTRISSPALATDSAWLIVLQGFGEPLFVSLPETPSTYRIVARVGDASVRSMKAETRSIRNDLANMQDEGRSLIISALLGIARGL